MQKLRKKGAAEWLGLLMILVVAGVLILGINKYVINGETLSVDGSDAGQEAQCTGGQTQSFTLKGVDEETGAANTDNFSYRLLGETAWTEGTMGTAITAGIIVGGDYEIVVGPSPTSEQGDSYGPYLVIENMPCRYVKEVNVVADTLFSDVVSTFYNEDNNAAGLNADASATPKWAHIKFAAASNEYAGNKYLASAPIGDNGNHRKQYPNVACMNLNSTTHDQPEAYYKGISMNRVSAPVVHAGEALHTTYCFEFPVMSENEGWYDIKFDPDDTEFAELDNDETLSIYSGSFFFHSKTADLMWGVETDDSNFVQFTAAETVTLDFTP